jgi:hypothetical protein
MAGLPEPLTVADPRYGLLVELEGNPCGCGESAAAIGPGTETHAARLDCCGCGKFRSWLPKAALDFLKATAARFGAPDAPIVYRDRTLTVGEQQMTAPEKGFQMKPGSGALFRNIDKKNDEDRDYSGAVNVDGVEFWLSGWIKQSKKTGKKYLSITVKPKDEPAAKSEGGAPFNDEIPFAPEWR